MTDIFYDLLNMSLKASYVILAVILVRFLLKKAPKKYSYALWAAAAFRLVCPVSFKSVISIFALQAARNNKTYVDLTQVVSPTVNTIQPQANVGIPAASTAINNSLPAPTPQYSANPMQIIMHIAMIVWLTGIAALLLYGVISYIRLHRKLRFAVKFEDNIWQSDVVSSPFIMGVVKPKIYIPFGLDTDKLAYVLAHEKEHIRRLDHIIKPLAFLILTVHWFNPLVWLSFYLMSRDMEMSCDEKVLSKNDVSSADYSTTLLSLAVKKQFPKPSPLAFGESGVKGRIKNALKFKKPAVWITVIAIIICVAVIFICTADPKDKAEEDVFGETYTASGLIYKAGSLTFGIDVSETAYYIDEDGTLYYRGWTEDPWHESEKLERFGLTKENFDDYFVNDDIWTDGYSVEKLRSENENAWKLEHNGDLTYILQQKNGELFYVFVSNVGTNDADIFAEWIIKLNCSDGVFGTVYSTKGLVCIDGMFSFVPEEESVGKYYVDNSGTLHERGWYEEDGWREIGTFAEFELTKNNFDDYFSGAPIWEDGYSVNELRRNNVNAWKFSADGKFYYLLEQKNGETYLAIGHDGEEFPEPLMRWIFLLKPTGTEELPQYPIAGDSYVSYQCLYMTPISSYAAVGGDSGYRYVFVMNEELAYCESFVRIERVTGNMLAMDYSDWGPFPYTEEEWNDMFVMHPVDISGYTAREWMQLNGSCALALMDSQHLWFVEIRGDEIWSIYSLVPEEYMGKATWNYTEGETLKIDFNIPGNMTAVCTQSDISSDGVSFDVGAEWSDGGLRWTPVNDSGEPVVNAQIHFSSDTGYAGTVYIVGSYGGDSMYYSIETSGTCLHIENAGENEAVIFVQEEIFAAEEDEEPTASRNPIDFTVDNTGEDFFRYEDIEGRTMNTYYDFTGGLFQDFSFPSPAGVSACSPIIVVGEIVDVYYADGDSVKTYKNIATVYDIKVSQVLRGDYVAGDMISVSQLGGYYRWYVQEPEVLQWAADGYTKFAGTPEVGTAKGPGGIPEMRVGEQYVMFLHDAENSICIDGTLTNVGQWTGAYKINDDNTVSRYIDAERIWTYGTLDELIQEVKENPFNEEKYYGMYN